MRTPLPSPAMFDDQSEARRLNGCALYVAENLDAFDGVWVLHTVFHFAGAMHDYLAEAGRSPMSREEVEHRLNLYGARIRLFERFLREVKLEIMQ